MPMPDKPAHISRKDWDAVDVPEMTAEDFTRAQTVSEAHPQLAERLTRGKQKAPTKIRTGIRLDTDVIEHFKKDGPGWQSRINETLRSAIGFK